MKSIKMFLKILLLGPLFIFGILANTANPATVWNCVNYVGELFLLGQNQTPFLNMIGGINGGAQVSSWEFPIAQTYALEAAAQPAITETASLTLASFETYTRSQTKNVCQIFQKGVSVSYAKQSDRGTLSGLNLAGYTQPVQNEKDFQITTTLQQIAVDVEYTFINGTYNLAGNSGQANRTRGMLEAISTNAVAAGSVALSRTLINALLKLMADNGAKFQNMILFVNSFQKMKLTSLYAYAPESRNVGGENISQIETDFCQIGVVYCPKMPTTAVGLFDMSIIKPVFLPVPEKGYLFYEELAKAGAAESGQIYGQIGLAYGEETMHGKITGLTAA